MPVDGVEPDNPLDLQSFLQAMHKEQCDQARQHEAMRQQSTAITVTLAGAIIAAATATAPHALDGLIAVHLPFLIAGYSLLGLFIVGLGWFGERLSLKHYERNRYHTTLAAFYRGRAEDMAPKAKIGKVLRAEAKVCHEKKWAEDNRPKYRRVFDSRVHQAWMALHQFTMASGALLAIIFIVIAIVATRF